MLYHFSLPSDDVLPCEMVVGDTINEPVNSYKFNHTKTTIHLLSPNEVLIAVVGDTSIIQQQITGIKVRVQYGLWY